MLGAATSAHMMLAFPLPPGMGLPACVMISVPAQELTHVYSSFGDFLEHLTCLMLTFTAMLLSSSSQSWRSVSYWMKPRQMRGFSRVLSSPCTSCLLSFDNLKSSNWRSGQLRLLQSHSCSWPVVLLPRAVSCCALAVLGGPSLRRSLKLHLH